MNRIEVQLSRDTQVLEFDSPVKAVRIADKNDAIRRAFPFVCLIIGVFLGKFLFEKEGEMYNPDTHRIMQHSTFKLLHKHGVRWSADHYRWEKIQGSYAFPILDIE